MATRSDVEARLRGYAEEYDRQFPPTVQAESRIMARIAITPRDVAPASALRRKGVLAGVLVRQLALVCVLLIFVGLLVVGATKLRALPRPNVPIGGVPTRPDVYFSALHFVSAREGWIAETKTSLASPLGGPTVLYKTTDGGVTWTPLTEGLNDLSVGAVSYAPSDSNVLRSPRVSTTRLSVMLLLPPPSRTRRCGTHALASAVP